MDNSESQKLQIDSVIEDTPQFCEFNLLDTCWVLTLNIEKNPIVLQAGGKRNHLKILQSILFFLAGLLKGEALVQSSGVLSNANYLGEEK